MNAASALLSMGLAAIFALSAIGKLRAIGSADATMRALRLPRVAARAAVTGLATIELVVAVALFLPPPIPVVAAAASTALALSFLIVVARAYQLGSREDCGCFGAGESSISVRLILRNVALLAAASLLTALTWAGAAALATLTAPDAAQTLLILLAATLLAAVLWLTLSGAAPAPTIEAVGPSPDEDAPHIVLVEQHNSVPRDISAATAWRAQLLVFVKPGCGSCEEVMVELDRRDEDLRRSVTPSLVVGAPTGQEPQERDDRFLLDPADHNARLLGLDRRRPAAVLLATDGSVVRPAAQGRDQILQLLDVLELAAES